MKLPLDTTLIVEDEIYPAELLKFNLCQKQFNHLINPNGIKSVTSFNQAVVELEVGYDLTILDMQLGNKRCFELFSLIPHDNFGIVAYITATNNYKNEELAIFNPHFFVNKPASLENVELFMSQLETELCKVNDIETTGHGDYTFKDSRGFYVVISEKDIYVVEGSGSYAYIHYRDGKLFDKILVKKTLKALQKLLPSERFWRVHDSFIINRGIYKKFKKDGNKGGVFFANDDVYIKLVRGGKVSYTNNYLKNHISI